MKALASLILALWIVAGSGWVLTRGDGRGLDEAALSLGMAQGTVR